MIQYNSVERGPIEVKLIGKMAIHVVYYVVEAEDGEIFYATEDCLIYDGSLDDE